MGMVPTSMCVCGHPSGYHDARDLPTGAVVELCSVWGCGCCEFETVADEALDDQSAPVPGVQGARH